MSAFRALPLLVIGLLLFVSACSGPAGAQQGDAPAGPSAPSEPDDDLPTPAPRRNLADYEDFDAAPYRDDAPAADEEIEHAVPERLLANRADAGVTRTVQGFRIQVYSAREKASADEVVEQAIGWWNARQEEQEEDSEASASQREQVLPDDLPVFVRYQQPYYRVRIGNFGDRDEAERALRVVSRRFPDAFIAPDTVTITR